MVLLSRLAFTVGVAARAFSLVAGSAANVGALPNCAATVTPGLALGAGTEYPGGSVGDCCARCTKDLQCQSWTWLTAPAKGGSNMSTVCNIRDNRGENPNPHNNPTKKISGIMTRPPVPPPPPAPVKPGTQKNLIFIINDDQDLMMGSMRAMPNTVRLLGEGGANMSEFRVNTPICCPSRSTMFTGRYEHNNKVAAINDGGCMYQNSSRTTNPDFWLDSHIKRLHDEHGYTTGMFGKTLNTWTTYGCDGKSGAPPGLDRQLVMCSHNYFNNSWVNQSTVVNTGDAPEDYTTSVMGNASVRWIKSVLDSGKDHPPFYAWIGPHAPHLPSIPAPWYETHPIGLLTPPRADVDPRYNYSASDHHPLVAVQPILNDLDAQSIDAEYAKRMRTLLSVDDIVVALHELLVSYDEWENTFVLFSSDHGYSLGQYRIPTHKMQVYDNCLRVPFLVKGPGITPGQQITALTQFADIGPSMLQFAGATATPASMDGRSFAPAIIPTLPKDPRPWRTEHLASYQSIYPKHCLVNANCGRHPIDDATNTHRSIRIVNKTASWMYAEFVDVSELAAWNFAPGSVQFRELYDMAKDPYQLHNLYKSASQGVKDEMAQRLRQAYSCSGTACP